MQSSQTMTRFSAIWPALGGMIAPSLCGLLLIMLPLTPISAVDAQISDEGLLGIIDYDEVTDGKLARIAELAASFRVRRAEVGELPEVYHQLAEQALAQTKQLLAQNNVSDLVKGRKLAIRTLRNYPFAKAAPELQHMVLRSYLATGRPSLVLINLARLWERYPEYDGITLAFSETLAVIEMIQMPETQFNIVGDNPRQVINAIAAGNLDGSLDVFAFLLQHGDRNAVAPYAALGISRGFLLRGRHDPKLLIIARYAYQELLRQYPRHPVVFDALMELALSYLYEYRGDQYDTGVLITAAELINQAEVYTAGNPERQATVVRYRAMIRLWHQERDLQVARWYRDRGQVSQAQFYYDACIEHDVGSRVADQARRERSELPSS